MNQHKRKKIKHMLLSLMILTSMSTVVQAASVRSDNVVHQGKTRLCQLHMKLLQTVAHVYKKQAINGNTSNRMEDYSFEKI